MIYNLFKLVCHVGFSVTVVSLFTIVPELVARCYGGAVRARPAMEWFFFGMVVIQMLIVSASWFWGYSSNRISDPPTAQPTPPRPIP